MRATRNVGLRFQRADEKPLRDIIARIRNGELGARGQGINLTIFEKAADSAAKGEPLIVGCTHHSEVIQMAELFVRLGVSRPAVEQLSPLWVASR